MNLDQLVNLGFCLSIVVLGIFIFLNRKDFTALYLSFAFTCFALTHGLNLMGYTSIVPFFTLAVRIVGYLFIIYALYDILTKKKAAGG